MRNLLKYTFGLLYLIPWSLGHIVICILPDYFMHSDDLILKHDMDEIREKWAPV